MATLLVLIHYYTHYAFFIIAIEAIGLLLLPVSYILPLLLRHWLLAVIIDGHYYYAL